MSTLDVHSKGTIAIATSHTTSVTLSGSATQLFIGVAWGGGGATISSVTWNGVSVGAALVSKDFGAGLDDHVALYAVKSPATGTHDIVVTLSTTPGNGVNVYYLSLTGGDTATGWRTATGRSDADGSGPGLTDANWVSTDFEIHLAAVWQTTITFDAGETAVQDNNITGSSWSAGLSYKTTSGTVGCTDESFYAECAVAAISGSAGTSAPMFRGS